MPANFDVESNISSVLNIRGQDRVSLGGDSFMYMHTEPYIADSAINSPQSINHTLRTLEDPAGFPQSRSNISHIRNNHLNLMRGNFRKNRNDLLKSLFKENKRIHMRRSIWKSKKSDDDSRGVVTPHQFDHNEVH